MCGRGREPCTNVINPDYCSHLPGSDERAPPLLQDSSVLIWGEAWSLALEQSLRRIPSAPRCRAAYLLAWREEAWEQQMWGRIKGWDEPGIGPDSSGSQ